MDDRPSVTADIGGLLYVFGGSNSMPAGTNYFAEAECLDLSNMAAGWQSLSPMPTARNAIGCAADLQGRIYVIGGADGVSNLGVVERYDPANDTWTTLPALGAVRSECGVARDDQGRIYAIGGGINLGTVTSLKFQKV